jgi:transposase
LTTKVHALTDGAGRVLVVRVTGGNVHDSPMFAQLMAALRVARTGPGRPRTRPDYLLADKAYSSRLHRSMLRRRGIRHTIAEPDDQKANRRRKGSAGGRPPTFDHRLTSSDTPSNAASTGSNATAPSPHGMTSSPSATRPPSTSPSTTTGS